MLTKLELVNRTQAAILAREARLYDWADSLWGFGCQGEVSARSGCGLHGPGRSTTSAMIDSSARLTVTWAPRCSTEQAASGMGGVGGGHRRSWLRDRCHGRNHRPVEWDRRGGRHGNV